jgi:hypothetical protein
MFKRLAHVDRFRGFSVTVPRAAWLGDGRAVRVGYHTVPKHHTPPAWRWWWRRHPVDTAVAWGAGCPVAAVRCYSNIAVHFTVRLSPRVSVGVSLLGRWAPRWWSRWRYDVWLRRLESERAAWLETLVPCSRCGEMTDPDDPFCCDEEEPAWLDV